MTTTQADSGADRPVDRVDRHFVATRPNQLWVSDFTYVATWRGFVYVAFVIDMFAPRIVGWRVANSLRTDFVLDALESAIYDRRGDGAGDLVQHSDRGTQYVSMRYTARLADAGSALSVGRRGAAYDNALAETIIGLFKTEVIRRRGPWRHIAAVEFATRAWVDWFNTRQLLEPIRYSPPVEYEERYYDQATVASLTSFALRRSRYGSHRSYFFLLVLTQPYFCACNSARLDPSADARPSCSLFMCRGILKVPAQHPVPLTDVTRRMQMPPYLGKRPVHLRAVTRHRCRHPILRYIDSASGNRDEVVDRGPNFPVRWMRYVGLPIWMIWNPIWSRP